MTADRDDGSVSGSLSPEDEREPDELGETPPPARATAELSPEDDPSEQVTQIMRTPEPSARSTQVEGEPVEVDDPAERETQVMDGVDASERVTQVMAESPAGESDPLGPPTHDASGGAVIGWQAERRSRRRSQPRLTAEAIDQAIRVADVDSRPLQSRLDPEAVVDPWNDGTPAAGVEGEIAMGVLGEVRRGTQRSEPVEPPTFGPIWWMGAGLVLALLVFAGVALVRTRHAVEETQPPPVEPVALQAVEPVPEAPEEPEVVVDRRELRSNMLAAFRQEEYVEAVAIGERLEAEFFLDWEAEFILAEAARLSRHYDDAVRRYADFIRKYPKNVRTDDAHYWMAETMRLQGNLKGARRHYRAVVDNRRSNLRSLAKKRLAKMK